MTSSLTSWLSRLVLSAKDERIAPPVVFEAMNLATGASWTGEATSSA